MKIQTKVQGYVKFFLLMSFVFSQTSVAADGISSEPVQTISNSKQALLDSMDDPIANRAFHNAQLQALQTPSDALIHRYFSANKVFAPLYQFLVKHNDSLVAGFELQAKSSMVQVVRGLTPKYDLIDKLVVDVASSLGFTKKVIQNRQIYILGGDENAFTVSGSQNKIIVAFQRGILRTMTRSEIAAVLGHELGHIRAEHTVKGIMNSVMLQIVGELFVSGRLGVMQEGTDFSKLTEDTCIGVCDHSKGILEKYVSAMGKTVGAQKEKIIDDQIQKFVGAIASLPKAKLQYLVGSYLQMALQVAIAEKAPVSTIKYFSVLLQNVANIGQFRVNPKEFAVHAVHIQNATSRAKETTADQISASTIRNEHLASAFAKLIGLDFDKEFRPQIFSQIKKQAEEILKTVPDSQLSIVAGLTHPSLVLRINNMLTFPAYPSVLFANNYLRLLLVNDALVATKYSAAQAFAGFEKQIQIELENLDKTIAEETGGKATPEQIKAIKATAINQVEQERAEYIANLKAIDESMQRHEARITQLLFSKNFPASAERSPRMDNTIQYFSIQKELALVGIGLINSELEKAKSVSPMDEAQISKIEYLERVLKSTQATLDAQKEFMARIHDRLLVNSKLVSNGEQYRNLNKRILTLEKILKTESSEELEKIRENITKVNPSVRENTQYRRNKIPVKLYSEQAGSPVCSKLFN